MSTQDALIFFAIICEAISCVTGFYYWGKIKNSFWKWFPIYLAFITLNEWFWMLDRVAKLGFFGSIANRNYWENITYEYVTILEFLFLSWIFYKHFSATRSRIWPLIGAAIFLLCLLFANLSVFDIEKWARPMISYNAGNIILLLLCLLFFFRFIKSDEILNYKSSMMFWVSLGILVFYLLTFPYFTLRFYLYNKFPSFFFAYQYISMVLGGLMYLFFTVAFICGRPKS